VTVSRIIRKKGAGFEATAEHSGRLGLVTGSISRAGRFKFDIDWKNDTLGAYTAHVDEDGAVQDGRTFDRKHTERWSTWSMKPIKCDGG
jgi:hypothetical protein